MRTPIKLNIGYYLPYIPKKCRKIRYEKCHEDIILGVRNVSSDDAPIAFILSDYHHVSEGKQIIRAYKGKLYHQLMVFDRDSEKLCPKTLEYLPQIVTLYLGCDCERDTKEFIVKEYRKEIAEYLLIDGWLWVHCGEPRYNVCTFGLGHNHGGTGLFVSGHYNPNLPKEWYFSALDWEKAIAKANDVAKRRGDTKDVGKFTKMIEVLMPKMVKVKPLKEHSDGDEFHRDAEKITQNSSSSLEAGLLVLMSCLK